jgi:site-specific recombinase XerD
MLELRRRHKPKCPHRDKGCGYLNCRCPIRVEGRINGKRYRESLKTRDLQRAARRLAELEDPAKKEQTKAPKEITEAVHAFLQHQDVHSRGTIRNNKRVMRFLLEFTMRRGIVTVEATNNLELLDGYRDSRPISALTWLKELEILRHFLGFCEKRKWCYGNAARDMETPTYKPAPREPYTIEQRAKILAAADQIGNYPYERLRARAMVLLFRYTALRISDVALLERSRVTDGHIRLRTMKNGKPVFLPVPLDLQFALDAVPIPRGTTGESKYFFWSGNGTTASAIRDVTRTMGAVFRKSGVPGAHAHKFRHTLATELLANGATAEDVAAILGNSAAIVRKHYEQWNVQRQERLESLMQAVFGSHFGHTRNSPHASYSESEEKSGGRHGIRTHDPGVANAVLSQLS